MTSTAPAPAVETVECPVCHVVVTPTREGGDRPREHNDADGKPCKGPRKGWKPTACRRCGKAPKAADGCGSPLFHPETWTVTVDDAGSGSRQVKVGNAAAAAAIVKVAGAQYQWLARVPPPGPRRAPTHIGIRHDGTRYYDLDAVREYVKHRPGPGGTGGKVSG